MNIEENRLETFKDCWPSDAVVSPARIARAGFFYTKQDQTVECFLCGLRISEWSYADPVMARHKSLSPECAFVLHPSTSTNVPTLWQLPPSMVDPNSLLNLAEESERLKTFKNWPIPHIVSPERLAKAGFYYLYRADKTKCSFCFNTVGRWEAKDDPDKEHQRLFPNCTFVLNIINRRIGERPYVPELNRDPSRVNDDLFLRGNLHKLGVFSHDTPKKTNYATVEARLATYSSWPTDLIQTPDALAQAGFYYEGTGDQVRCYHCDGGLRHWDPEDDPWTEHARWFPRCVFVQVVKGHDFIAACELDERATSYAEDEGRKLTTPKVKFEISDYDVYAHLNTPIVEYAQNKMFLHPVYIMHAIRKKWENTGSAFTDAGELVEATLIEAELDKAKEAADRHVTLSHTSQDVSHILETALDMSVTDSEALPKENTMEQCKIMEDIVSESSSPQKGKSPASLEEENRALKEARLCKVCMDSEVCIVFLPCGHLASCVECTLNMENCPVCRTMIRATVRTFLS